MAASMRRLITHTRNRSEDVSDSPDALSPSLSSSPSRRQRPQIGLPVLGKVGSAESGSSRRAKPLQISSPQLPDAATGDAASVMSGDVTRSATVHHHNHHRRNGSDTTGWSSSAALRKQLLGARGQQRNKAPQRPFNPFNTAPSKADVALQRSASLRQKPPRPPRPDEVPPRLSSRRPSIKSVSSDSFVQTLSSRRASLATSDPGSIFQERSKDDLDSQNDNIFSDELRNFILEADRAFQLGGDPSLSLPKQRNPIKPAPPSRTGSTTPRAAVAPTRPAIPRKTVGSGTSIKRTTSTSRPIKPSATVSGRVNHKDTREDSGLARRNSATAPNNTKIIQKRSPPSPVMPRKKISWEARMEAKGSKWGLSEGMTDILSGHRFRKIEADEMLTPERMEELRAERHKQRLTQMKEEEEREIDNETSWIDIGLDTSEGETSPSLSPSRSKTSSPDFDSSSPSTPPLQNEDGMGDDAAGEIPIMFRDSSYEEPEPRVLDPVHDALPPTPPPKSRRRKLTITTSNDTNKPEESQPEDLKLPSPALKSSTSSVYTDSSFSPGPATPVHVSELRRKLSAAEDDANIYLRSTPFTFTHPTFEHGAITFNKADIGRGVVKMDDTLDWTAFQMAILGGAGEIDDVVEEWEDARLTDELVKWFDGHGFEDWGRMVLEEEAMRDDDEVPKIKPSPARQVKTKHAPQVSISSMTSSSASSSTSSLDSISSRGRLGTGSGATPPPLNIRRKQPPLPTLTSRCMPKNDGSLGSTRASVVQTKSPARGPAIVGGGGPGDVEEDEADAPMGFNLSSDLGEYLQWEAEYAYATDL